MSASEARDAVAAMTTAVQALSTLIEQPPPAHRDRQTSLLRALGTLISTAVSLPVGDASAVPDEIPTSSPDRRKSIEHAFPFLGLYWTVFDANAMAEIPDAVVGDGVDDLAEIMADLHAGLCAAEVAPEAGLWVWRESFRSHWSRHAAHLYSTLVQAIAAQGRDS